MFTDFKSLYEEGVKQQQSALGISEELVEQKLATFEK